MTLCIEDTTESVGNLEFVMSPWVLSLTGPLNDCN